jgi:hypothetical protein
MLLPWPAERAVEDLLDGTQGDPIVLGTNQEAEPREGSIEKLGLGHRQVFELGDVELLPELFAPAHLVGTGVTTSRAIRTRECVSCSAILEQARLFKACVLAIGGRFSRAGLHAPHRRGALDDAVEKRNQDDGFATAGGLAAGDGR